MIAIPSGSPSTSLIASAPIRATSVATVSPVLLTSSSLIVDITEFVPDSSGASLTAVMVTVEAAPTYVVSFTPSRSESDTDARVTVLLEPPGDSLVLLYWASSTSVWAAKAEIPAPADMVTVAVEPAITTATSYPKAAVTTEKPSVSSTTSPSMINRSFAPSAISSTVKTSDDICSPASTGSIDAALNKPTGPPFSVQTGESVITETRGASSTASTRMMSVFDTESSSPSLTTKLIVRFDVSGSSLVFSKVISLKASS